MSKAKWWAIGAAVLFIVLTVVAIWALYQAGDADQSALERLRDIAVIFIVALFLVTVLLLAAITAALGFLTFQVKDRMIPLLEELTGTARRIRGTAEFMSEEAVKPFLTVAGTYAKMRGTMKSFVSRGNAQKH
jgi:amino acid transporter